MPITKIIVKRANHESMNLLTSFRLQLYRSQDQDAEEDPNKLEVSGNTVKLTMPPFKSSLGQQAVDRLVAMGAGWLRSINHISTQEGQFLITGDACFAWKPGTTQIHTYVQDTTTTVNGVAVQSYLNELGGSVTILNMCAACGSCSTESALRVMLENVKLKLNELKDVNLYDSSRATIRRGVLRSNLMSPNASCNIPVRTWITDTVHSTMLLGQYATCIHMWNYIASRAHAHTTVEPAAQDPAGLLVRSKRAFPACLAGSPAHGTGGTIKCVIEVRRVTRTTSQGHTYISPEPSTTNTDISVYIPPACTEVKPFENSGVGEHDATVVHDVYDATHKTITAGPWTVGASNTYMVSVYVLPFNYAELADVKGTMLNPSYADLAPSAPDDPTTPDDDYRFHPESTSVVDPSDSVGYPATRYASTAATLTRRVKYNTADTGQTPTGEDMYNMYKVYPSVADHNSKYLWEIEITWTMTGLEDPGIPDIIHGSSTNSPVSFTERFYLETRRPRTPASTLIPADSTEVNGYKMFTNTTLYDVKPRGSR